MQLNQLITTQLCTCHDSCAVMLCAKVCSNLVNRNLNTAYQFFCHIWISSVTPLVKRSPGHPVHHILTLQTCFISHEWNNLNLASIIFWLILGCLNLYSNPLPSSEEMSLSKVSISSADDKVVNRPQGSNRSRDEQALWCYIQSLWTW